MLKFLKKVKAVNPPYAGPIVVHCRSEFSESFKVAASVAQQDEPCFHKERMGAFIIRKCAQSSSFMSFVGFKRPWQSSEESTKLKNGEAFVEKRSDLVTRVAGLVSLTGDQYKSPAMKSAADCSNCCSRCSGRGAPPFLCWRTSGGLCPPFVICRKDPRKSPTER